MLTDFSVIDFGLRAAFVGGRSAAPTGFERTRPTGTRYEPQGSPSGALAMGEWPGYANLAVLEANDGPLDQAARRGFGVDLARADLAEGFARAMSDEIARGTTRRGSFSP